MKNDKYTREVVKTQNPEADCWEHYVLGLTDEVGEIAKLFKKAVQSGDPGNVPIELLMEELGDLEYFLVSLGNLYGLPISKIRRANIKKLRARYKSAVYSTEGDFQRDVGLEQSLLEEVMRDIEELGK